MNVCGTKPPPRLSSANRPQSRATIPRERCSGGRGSGVSSYPTSTPSERRSNHDEPGTGGERIAEQPFGRRPDDRKQRAGGARERRDRVVGAEEGRRIASLGGVREHRLLERGEGAGLDDVGGDRPGQRGGDQRGQPAGQREDRACDSHRDEQDPVAAAAADPVAVPREQDRDQGVAGENRGEDGADGGIRVPAVGERDADEHRAEPVRDRSHALGRDDPARVAAQSASS